MPIVGRRFKRLVVASRRKSINSLKFPQLLLTFERTSAEDHIPFMNLAVFASGRGSNARAILRAIDEGRLAAQVSLILSNRSDAGALDLARSEGIDAVHCSHTMFASEDAFAARLLSLLEEHGVDAIALAGYLKRVPQPVIARYRHRILNIHPALLPAFGGEGMYGHHVHEAVLASGAKISGATVHLVDEEYDRGAILLQGTVEVMREDTPETLAARVLTVEHELLPRALDALAHDRVAVDGRRAWIL
jgi:phosphoribosylglycinamide formyltransferase 1